MKVRFAINSVLYIMFLPALAWAERHIKSVGIIGDSMVTGAVSHSDINISKLGLTKLGAETLIFSSRDLTPDYDSHIYKKFGIARRDVTSPLRIYFDLSEIGSKSLPRLQAEAVGSSRIDIEEHSFGYLVAKSLGVPSEKIVFVAQDGKRVKHLPKQLHRLNQWQSYEMKTFWTPSALSPSRYTVKTEFVTETLGLPDLVLISFVGNDMCKESKILGPKKMYEDYYNSLLNGYKHLVEKTLPAKNGTDVIYITAIDPVQVLDNNDLLNTEVPFNGGTTTCRSIRTDKKPLLPKALQKMCPTIFNTDLNDKPRLNRLRDHWKAIVQAQIDATEVAQSWGVKGFRFSANQSLSNYKVAKGEVANDCYHPSFSGHGQFAKLLLESMNQYLAR